ncbi:MAG: transcriptional repressor [Magnetococcales bacterium]|nr:transcriptional repressor [Magnetococcales bacterium]
MAVTTTVQVAPFPKSGHDHARCRDWMIERAESLCLDQGLRFTPQRREVLEILATAHQCLGAYDILERMGHRDRRPPPAAVYRSLDFLMELNLVHRMTSRNAFFACTRAEHAAPIQFWICRHCGVVGESESTLITDEVARLAGQLAFRPETINVEIEGACQTCRTP